MNETPTAPSLRAYLKPILATLTTSGLSRSKQESTILAIVDRQAAGEAFDTAAFWLRSDTAARSTYKKWRQHDTAFVSALELARTAVRDWQADQAITAVEDALLKLQLATPDFVNKIIKIAKESENDFAALNAAFGGLDRAHKNTAPKTQDVEIPGLDSALEKIYGDEPEDDDD